MIVVGVEQERGINRSSSIRKHHDDNVFKGHKTIKAKAALLVCSKCLVFVIIIAVAVVVVVVAVAVFFFVNIFEFELVPSQSQLCIKVDKEGRKLFLLLKSQ